MSEFHAKQAREFTENKDQINCDKWYAEFKEELFEMIKVTALDGNNSIRLNLMGDVLRMNHLIIKLTALGYKCDPDSRVLIISW